MTLHVYNFEQGTDEWHDARRGIVTASVVGKLLTSTGSVAVNDTSRDLTRHLVAERITGYTEPTYVSADMERGNLDEPIARDIYSAEIAPVTQVGFMVRDDWGWKAGYSPDGLVGDNGLIEIKSRRQKAHLKTILDNKIPADNIAQIQMGLLVSGRQWCDYVSFCGGMPLYTIRMFPDMKWQEAILEAIAAFEDTAERMTTIYNSRTEGLPETERSIDLYTEMTLNGHH